MFTYEHGILRWSRSHTVRNMHGKLKFRTSETSKTPILPAYHSTNRWRNSSVTSWYYIFINQFIINKLHLFKRITKYIQVTSSVYGTESKHR